MILLNTLLLPFTVGLIAPAFAVAIDPRVETLRPTILPSGSFPSAISFAACSSSLGLPKPLECANFSVPIDWDKPRGDRFDLGVVRLPARVKSKKVGSLFINPGGPGGAASGFLASLVQGDFALPPELYDVFDIIGLDPRGIALSHEVKCDQKIWAERVSWFPQTQEEYSKLIDKNKRFGKSCRKLTGPLVEHVDSISVAKDHEAVRIALGNEPLNMIAASYGTIFGAQYATLFPNNIRSLVLDGMLQHSQSDASNSLIESVAYTLALQRFFKWAGSEPSSPLNGKNVESIWASLLSNASRTDLPAPACTGTTTCRPTVNAEEITFNAQQGLIIRRPEVVDSLVTWGTLASAIYNATYLNDASAFSTRFDPHDMVSGTAIACLDWTHDPSLLNFNFMKAKKHMLEGLFPLTKGSGEFTMLRSSCIGWPYATKNKEAKMDVKTKNTILTVNSDADPSTGYGWAIGSLEEIKNKVLITRVGDGHTSFFTEGDTAKAIGEYLITGKAPEDGLVLNS